MTYGICSDVHLHNWSAFSRINEYGLNSRLVHILNEIRLAAEATKRAGGKTLYITGDLFHVRGSVAPSVLNPTIDLFTTLTREQGLVVRILAGNHDLESRDSNALSNACESLRTIPGIEVISTPALFHDDRVVMVPWYDRLDDVRQHIGECLAELVHQSEAVNAWTLMLHAPVDDVIAGLPNHGFQAAELAAYGFKQVFCGHYHNHKYFPGDVFSVGATTHQTWNDVGTRAGYLIVTDSGVAFHPSQAPRYMDFDICWDDATAAEYCRGNYVRLRLGEATSDEISHYRSRLEALGALGTFVQAIPLARSAVPSRRTQVASAPTLRESISQWIRDHSTEGEALEALCHDILTEAEAIRL
ncbi:calcineurin-like phosphoesterase family protein [Pseudomonas duriflava]|uniref:Calcineurin-like phosphoesterase family protein n=1 Tax=Pseudomonas duriflava TaxID=459528 RepID=A0A562PV26_9PSED|nr:metallophosphoesterase [Pseudomonas duriflava]TWI48010.1 calcineurin-like phosphoesterase family protein [Pseudomonas duriflava]